MFQKTEKPNGTYSGLIIKSSSSLNLGAVVQWLTHRSWSTKLLYIRPGN